MIDSELYSAIYKRKSFHLFREIGNESISSEEWAKITEAYKHFSPLCSDIKTTIRIVPAVETTCKRGEEYCILLYSGKKEGYLQNIGYIGEQLDLYLTQKNIATLWFGIGKTEELQDETLDFVIMLAVAKITDETKFRKDMFKAKRKPIEEIWGGEHIKVITDIARFAPGACNTQQWIVEHTENKLYVYRYKKPGKRGIMPADKVSFCNQIDIGIFLCFLELCLLHKRVSYTRELNYETGVDNEKTLFAVYQLQETLELTEGNMITPKLETDRLILREIHSDDIEEIFNCWMHDEDVSKYMWWKASDDVNEAKDFVEFELGNLENDKWNRWIIVLKNTNEIIGTCLIFFNDDEGHWDISYNLGKKFWSNGYVTEAMSAVMKYAVEVMKIKEISTTYAIDNSASGHVLQKLGFQFIKEVPYECNGGDIITTGRYMQYIGD